MRAKYIKTLFMRKASMHSIWLVLLLSVLSSSVSAGTLGALTYKITEGQVAITDCGIWASGDLEVPAQIKGSPVTSIGDSAFDRCIRLTSITIPEGRHQYWRFGLRTVQQLDLDHCLRGRHQHWESGFQLLRKPDHGHHP